MISFSLWGRLIGKTPALPGMSVRVRSPDLPLFVRRWPRLMIYSLKGAGAMPVVSSMEAFLGTIGTFFTQSVTWMGDILNIVVENPALTIMVIAMPIVGFAVGLLGRLIRL